MAELDPCAAPTQRVDEKYLRASFFSSLQISSDQIMVAGNDHLAFYGNNALI